MKYSYETEYWEGRYKKGLSSGNGSCVASVKKKVELLAGLDKIDSIVEIGAGDFNFGRHLMDRFNTARYFGYDISETIVKRNNHLYGLSRVQFFKSTAPYFPMADLLLCVDVLFHIIDDDDYVEMLQILKDADCRFMAVTAYEYDAPSSEHVRIRKFDPLQFGEPILREVIEEDGEMMFYIYRR